MENKSLQILLSNVVNNGKINSLIDLGLNFKEIANLTDFAIQEGFIVINADQIELSDSGIEKLKELRKNRKNIPQKEWIVAEEKSRILKITKDFIFLPRQDELP
ncbi:hypothetical protein [Mucilaginibacter sp.]|uniref:hypothetical protein n=1 Tax=Mucilaginibacter sp. TaxID=1882438 RepID=UPI00283AF0F6|nr:hypothetical protein [Mucilaginibacter sp.]MDR3693540.1 hypothetical protein [Mucilaginibacter sp.]